MRGFAACPPCFVQLACESGLLQIDGEQSSVAMNLLSIGIYTIPEAARLTGVSAARIRRWLKGYDFKSVGKCRHSAPVWTGQLPPIDQKLAVGFRDLMEVRFVAAFINAGVSWRTMRLAHEAAKRKLSTDHPFCTHRFATDGRAILMEQARVSGDPCLIDVVNDQCEFQSLVEQFLKELEFDDGVVRWWPLGKDRKVVVDPVRNMGKPIVANSGVSTTVIARSVIGNQSERTVAAWYEVTLDEVRDAVEFERRLAA